MLVLSQDSMCSLMSKIKFSFLSGKILNYILIILYLLKSSETTENLLLSHFYILSFPLFQLFTLLLIFANFVPIQELLLCNIYSSLLFQIIILCSFYIFISHFQFLVCSFGLVFKFCFSCFMSFFCFTFSSLYSIWQF